MTLPAQGFPIGAANTTDPLAGDDINDWDSLLEVLCGVTKLPDPGSQVPFMGQAQRINTSHTSYEYYRSAGWQAQQGAPLCGLLTAWPWRRQRDTAPWLCPQTLLKAGKHCRFGNASSGRPPLVLINGLASTMHDWAPTTLKVTLTVALLARGRGAWLWRAA